MENLFFSYILSMNIYIFFLLKNNFLPVLSSEGKLRHLYNAGEAELWRWGAGCFLEERTLSSVG